MRHAGRKGIFLRSTINGLDDCDVELDIINDLYTVSYKICMYSINRDILLTMKFLIIIEVVNILSAK